jgi:hypothetical protein
VSWFTRRRPQADNQVDAVLAPLSITDAALLRRSVQRWLAEHGREAVMAAGHATIDAELGLVNLARLCAQQTRGSAAWPTVVDAHLTAVLAALPERVDMNTISPEEFARQVMLRLWPDDIPDLTADAAAGWAEVAPGLVQTLVLDEAATVRTIAVYQAARIGEQFLLAAARNNLAHVPYNRQVVSWQDMSVDVLRSESSYAASQLLVLNHVLAEIYPARVASLGILLAVPDRSMLMLHVVESGTGEHLIATMGRYARERYGRVPWPLSPHVYWWQDGDVRIANTRQRTDRDDPATSASYSAFKRAVDDTEPTPQPVAPNLSSGDSTGPVIDLEQFPPAAREVLSVAWRVCAEQMVTAIKEGSTFNPFVLMGTRGTFDLVLINNAELRPAKVDPFSYMRQFMTRPNEFAIMAVTARFRARDDDETYSHVAVLQIEHEANVSTRVAIPYRLTASRDPRFGQAFPDRHVPADWPAWNQGLETTS